MRKRSNFSTSSPIYLSRFFTLPRFRINRECTLRFHFHLYEYAIRLEMKDALVGGHEFYRFPLPPLVLHLSTVLQDAGFSGFSGLLGFRVSAKGDRGGPWTPPIFFPEKSGFLQGFGVLEVVDDPPW